MPAKKSTTREGEDAKVEDKKQSKVVESGHDKTGNDDSKTIPTKRKQSKDSQEGPDKAPRRSARGKAKPNVDKILHFLISPEALDLCRPKDEKEDLKKRKEIKTYAESGLTPFEELISAVVLSRPISHALGVRTIRTIFNNPYNFSSPKAILDAGDEKVHQALWDARTQHKDKTADQLILVAKVITEEFEESPDSTDLEKVRAKADKETEKISDLLTSAVKGLGKTGMSIFFRRVQWLWEEVYPYVDERTGKALGELGLPSDAKKLVKLVDNNWYSIKETFNAYEGDKAKRRAFVVLLERAIGAGLEKNTAAILEKVA